MEAQSGRKVLFYVLPDSTLLSAHSLRNPLRGMDMFFRIDFTCLFDREMLEWNIRRFKVRVCFSDGLDDDCTARNEMNVCVRVGY